MHKLNVRVVVLIWGQCYGFHKVHQSLAPMVNVVHALLLPQSLSGASHRNQQGTEWQNDITLTHAHKKQKQFFDSWSFLVFFYSLLAVVIFRSYKKYALKEIIFLFWFPFISSNPLLSYVPPWSAVCRVLPLLCPLVFFKCFKEVTQLPSSLAFCVFLFQLTTCYFQILLVVRQLIFCRHFISIHWPSSVYHGWFGNKTKVCSFLCHSYTYPLVYIAVNNILGFNLNLVLRFIELGWEQIS